MGLGLARPSPNRPGPIYQLGPRLAQAQRWPKGSWPKLALGRIFLAQAQPKKMLGRTGGPIWPKSAHWNKSWIFLHLSYFPIPSDQY